MALKWSEPVGQTILDHVASVSWSTIAIAAVIGGIGATTLYSVGGGDVDKWAMPHVLRLLAGLGGVLLMAAVPLRAWLALAFPVYAFGLLTVALVPVFGTQALGAQRWLDLGVVSFQPSEVMKVGLILALARLYQMVPPGQVSWPRIVALAGAMIAVPLVLILDQPDLGTATLLAAIGFGLVFLAGTGWGWFAGGTVAALGAVPFAWELLHDYQRQRILVFLQPDADTLGNGYQINQAKIAVGSGGYMGKGLMQGTQSQLNFVPEKHTDFIFTMFAEEMGFVGCMVLLALYLALIWSIGLIAMRSRNVFGRLVCAGVAIALFVHVFVNIAMVMGVAPVVGVPLPLMSYGGTSLISTLFGFGLAMSAHASRKTEFDRRNLGWLV